MLTGVLNPKLPVGGGPSSFELWRDLRECESNLLNPEFPLVQEIKYHAQSIPTKMLLVQ